MAPTPEHHEIAASIDKEVNAYPDTAGGMEQLLLHMYKYMHRMFPTIQDGKILRTL
ncbi:MAG: hypothetical protein GY794_23945 [bacterium]|nr:hypothetical protein [bacterium]